MKEIGKCVKGNGSENTMYQSLWGAVKEVLRGNLQLKMFTLKMEKPQKHDFTLAIPDTGT